MIPSWSQRTKEMRFVTKKLEPKAGVTMQKHYVQVIARTLDVNTFVLDGVPVPSSQFKSYFDKTEMSYANLELVGEDRSHLLTTTGDGFVGFVYGMTDGQAYQYTLGYTIDPNLDSLYIRPDEDTTALMHSYDMKITDNGWYQRQLRDWKKMEEQRVDTAWVCDSTKLTFRTKLKEKKRCLSPSPSGGDDSGMGDDSGYGSGYSGYGSRETFTYYNECFYKATEPLESEIVEPIVEQTYDWTYFFEVDHTIDPITDPWERPMFDLFSVEMLITRNPQICTGDVEPEIDTLRSIIRVNRSYNDTILRRMVCITDTVKCFKDKIIDEDPENRDAHGDGLKQTLFASKEHKTNWRETAEYYVDSLVLGYNVYTRHYQSIFGCDSIATFELYVCDTVRIVTDTAICANEILEFKGSEYFQDQTFNTQGVYIDTIKTRGCNAMKQLYDPKNLFHGCDSIWEVHLTTCDTFNIYTRDTVCPNGHDMVYEWYRKGHFGQDSLVKRCDIWAIDEGLQYELRDTVHTTTCPNCAKGGCDSIFILHLFLASHVNDTMQYAYCGQTYDDEQLKLVDVPFNAKRFWPDFASDSVWDTNNQRRIPADSIQKMTPGTTNIFVDSTLTENGCDIVHTLILTRNAAFFNLDRKQMASNETYTWTGHFHDTVIGPLSERAIPYVYYDSAQTIHGCDSIYRLELTIAQTFEETVPARICDNEVYVWQNHTSQDKYRPTTAGPRQLWDNTNGRVIYSNQLYGRAATNKINGFEGYSKGEYIIIDSLKMDKIVVGKEMKVDSVWILHLIVDSTYDHHISVALCDTESYVFDNIRYYARDYAKPYPEIGTFEKTVHLEAMGSEKHCDSTVTMHMTVYPHFYQFDSIHLCSNKTTQWPNRLDKMGRPISVNATLLHNNGIDINQPGVYTVWDRDKTVYGCDSVYELRILITQSYLFEKEASICYGESTFVWDEHISEAQVADWVTVRKLPYDSTYILWDSLTTVTYGCDSVYRLALTVHPTFKHVDQLTMCDNDTMTWQGHLYVGSQFKGNAEGDAFKIVRFGENYDDSVNYNTISVYHCDSIYLLDLAVYKSFYKEEKPVILCHFDDFTWQGHEGHALVDEDGDPVDITHVTDEWGEYTFVDHLYNNQCLSCNGGKGCDSVYVLKVTVNPAYKQHKVVVQPEVICQTEVPFVWYGHSDPATVSGYKEYSASVHVWDTLKTIALECDSVVELQLTVVDNMPRTLKDTVCQNDAPFVMGQQQFLFSPKDSLPGDYTQVAFVPIGTSCSFEETLMIHVNPVYDTTFVDTVCQVVRGTYTWQNHIDKTYSISEAGEITDVDSLLTVARCDSVWHLRLKVLPTYRDSTSETISDEMTTIWQDTLYAGKKAEIPEGVTNYVIITKDTTVYTKLSTEKVGTHVCDSILIHTIRIGKVFRDTIYDYVCDNCDYIWSQPQQDGTTLDRTIKGSELQEGYSLFPIKLQTQLGFDSIFNLSLYKAPTYVSFETNDTVCQLSEYLWQGHADSEHRLYYRGQGIDYDEIPTDVYGEIVIQDSLKTKSWFIAMMCDSVWTLHLNITPIYTEEINTIIDTLYIDNNGFGVWQNRLYKGNAYLGEQDESIYDAVYVVTKDTTDSKAFKTDIARQYPDKLDCDSIRFLQVLVNYHFSMADTICKDSAFTWTGHDFSANHIYLNGQLVHDLKIDQAGRFEYIDSLKTASRQDSVWTLQLLVAPSYRIPSKVTLSNEDSVSWQGTLYVGENFVGSTEGYTEVVVLHNERNHFEKLYDAYYDDTHRCDSLYTLDIRIGQVFRDTTYDFVCDNCTYVWTVPTQDNGTRDIIINGADLQEKYTFFYDSLETELGFDSIYNLKLYRMPTYHRTHVDTICQYELYKWENHERPVWSEMLNRETDEITTDVSGTFFYLDSLKTQTEFLDPHGIHSRVTECDSIWRLEIYVPKVYKGDSLYVLCDNGTTLWQRRLYVGEKYDKMRWGELPLQGDDYDTLINVRGVDRYLDTVRYVSALSCDSIFYLELVVNQSKYEKFENNICDNDSVWTFGHGKWYHEAREFWPKEMHDYTKVRKDTTIVMLDSCLGVNGCDSVAELTLHIYPSYRFDTTMIICSSEYTKWRSYDAINRWHTGTFYDTVPGGTKAHHCDSVYVLHLTIKPSKTVRYYEHVCIGDSIYFDGTWYGYDPSHDNMQSESVVYYINTYSMAAGCDSTLICYPYWHPKYLFEDSATVCDNETYLWHNSRGDTLLTPLPGNGEEVYYDSLKSHFSFIDPISGDYIIGRGCDSVYKFTLKHGANYHYVHRDTVCQTLPYVWSGHEGRTLYCPDSAKYFETIPTLQDGDTITLVDSLQSIIGCDSIWTLKLYVASIYNEQYNTQKVTDYRSLCDNDTLVWENRLYMTEHFEEYYHTTIDRTKYDEVILVTGDLRDRVHHTSVTGCDSIRFLNLKLGHIDVVDIYPVICNDEDYKFGSVWEWNHSLVLPEGTHRDVLIEISDTLTNSTGCDSITNLHLTVHPTYEHYDKVSLCTNETDRFTWHGRTYLTDKGGIITDRFDTITVDGCDSAFFLTLDVRQAYYIHVDTALCVTQDVDFTWHGVHIVIPYENTEEWYRGKEFKYEKSYQTKQLCDSNYYMTVHVSGIKYEEVWDTICTGDYYDFHGVSLIERGLYVDTILQEETGCDLITTLHLEEIPPTKVDIAVSYFCLDDGRIGLGFQFQGKHPRGYTITYSDDFIRACAERNLTPDMNFPRPLAQDENDIEILLPELWDSVQYIRPDDYSAAISFHGVCLDDRLTTTAFRFSLRYPSWLMEQHWNDVIGVLVDSLNGGYHFTDFQWYKDDVRIPGETHPYLYCPQYLEETSEYSVALTRSSDGKTFMTCPMIPSLARPQTLSPQQPYISVVPTLVVRENPVVNILCVNDGEFDVYDSYGRKVDAGHFVPGVHNAYEVHLPSTSGVYVFSLRESSGLSRNIKVIVE